MNVVEYEIQRQKTILETLGPKLKVPQETRGFNSETWKTFKLRSKEDAPDYRYMPDPNLGVLVLSEVCITMSIFAYTYNNM